MVRSSRYDAPNRPFIDVLWVQFPIFSPKSFFVADFGPLFQANFLISG